jgi:phosphoesterase RecJ-like protein
MDSEAERFKDLLESAQKVMVTSHISPDPDAVTSTLLVGRTLRSNYPNKKIEMILEEQPARSTEFLKGYTEIDFRPLADAVTELKPDLFILLDSPNFERISRTEATLLRAKLKEVGARIAIIDHHEEHGRDQADIYINNHRPATVQEAYELLFDRLNLHKPSGYAQTTLLGIISDTARHKFDNPSHRDTYRIVSDLLDAGASIEQLESKMNRYDRYQIEVLHNLLSHIRSSQKGYTFSFVDDGFSNAWLKNAKPIDSFKLGVEEFTNVYLRNLENNFWGFAVYREMVGEGGMYRVSLRSLSGTRDVSKIAYKLGGGGHKAAAGAKFAADDIEQALEKVKKAIKN